MTGRDSDLYIGGRIVGAAGSTVGKGEGQLRLGGAGVAQRDRDANRGAFGSGGGSDAYCRLGVIIGDRSCGSASSSSVYCTCIHTLNGDGEGLITLVDIISSSGYRDGSRSAIGSNRHLDIGGRIVGAAGSTVGKGEGQLRLGGAGVAQRDRDANRGAFGSGGGSDAYCRLGVIIGDRSCGSASSSSVYCTCIHTLNGDGEGLITLVDIISSSGYRDGSRSAIGSNRHLDIGGRIVSAACRTVGKGEGQLRLGGAGVTQRDRDANRGAFGSGG